MLAPHKESVFGCSCRLWLLSWRRARVFARSCSLLSKYLPISWKQRKEQSHAQCHVTHRIRIFDKISEHVKVAKSVDIAVPELAVTQRLKELLQVLHGHNSNHSRTTEDVQEARQTSTYAYPNTSETGLVIANFASRRPESITTNSKLNFAIVNTGTEMYRIYYERIFYLLTYPFTRINANGVAHVPSHNN